MYLSWMARRSVYYYLRMEEHHPTLLKVEVGLGWSELEMGLYDIAPYIIKQNKREGLPVNMCIVIGKCATTCSAGKMKWWAWISDGTLGRELVPYVFPLVVMHTRSIISFHLWCMIRVRVWKKSNLLWFIEGQIHFGTS